MDRICAHGMKPGLWLELESFGVDNKRACKLPKDWLFCRHGKPLIDSGRYHLDFRNVRLKGKYSFQYITDAVFENCDFDTKDAFWHAKNVIIRNSVVKGEYLAWYSENVTFENCRIIGTQPLCYCRNLKLADCEMIDTDLAFERSEVEARITTPVISIKNPYAGHITVPEVGEIIRDDENAKGVIETLR